jgi:tyrosyl-tRNA synthetase
MLRFRGAGRARRQRRATAYVGQAAPRSLHIGNYLTMMMLYWLQQAATSRSR